MHIATFLIFLSMASAAGWAAPITYKLPPDTAELAPGPGRDSAEVCSACHSVDYITTQPRRLPNPTAFWTAEVTKMRHAYGAPIDDAEARKIIDYLVATYADKPSEK
jgi:sulfite dehydrogenase (cytochrome) subunit B